MMNSGDATRLYRSNAHTKQTLATLFANCNHNKFYEYTISFVSTLLFKNNLNLMGACNLINSLICFELNMFGKSLLLNGLVNFCIVNSDGITIQHKMLTNVLSFLLEKYY
ncbi:Mv-ORF11 peptide [Maruca vitrata nucleopolyhedrovirus]|uniref:Mv-ORF11 peptide n=1 Tax=Maruca vitrata nucleopolyhedrovirus TaxID=1307954 RepID=A1YR73_9ABAC|nr:Mv-ORF11 peptide [Maruca vitrata nucleopolyhedrovirus]ABL75963.1 Mv-ORF11 peptide [Maruca vitrata nucleopolyhedrovirus]